MSTDGWMDQYVRFYTHTDNIVNGISFSNKKGALSICDNMDGPWEHYAKRNESDRETQMPHDLTYLQNIKYDTTQMNLFMKQKQTHRHRQETVVPKGKVGGKDKLGVWN